MLIITTTVLIRQSRFNSSTLLRSLSYSIALSIRSAQVYGTSVRGITQSVTTVYAPAYGAYFNGSTSYLLFADINNNGTYDSGTDSVVQSYQVGGGFQIDKFCGYLANGSRDCWLVGGGGTSSFTWLSIYFKRPNPDALFASSLGNTYVSAYIETSALNDPTNLHCVSVTSTGEISVLQPSQCS
jgi:hypothetical protein